MSNLVEVVMGYAKAEGAKGFLMMEQYAHNGNAVQSQPMSPLEMRELAIELLQTAKEMETMQ